MTATKPTTEMLKSVKIFNDLSKDELAVLAKIMTFERRPAGSQLVFEDQRATEVFFIIDGRVRIEMSRVQGGAPELLTTISGGETVGELALARQGRRTASALTQMATELCVCDAKILNAEFEKHPAIGLKVFRNLTNVIAERLSNMNFMIRNTTAP